MRFVVIDFETFFADDFTLSKMSTEAYIRDPRFEPHGAAIKWSASHAAKWYDAEELQWVLKNEDWADTCIICHHFQFDGLILSHYYGIQPAMRGCTLSMARLLLGNHLSVSLDSVRKYYGMPLKRTPYQLFKNKHWHELTPAVQQELADGACDEVESIWQLFGRFIQEGFPYEELKVVDIVLRMFTEPVLQADVELLAQIWEQENANKSQRLAALNVTATELQSADKFANLLRAEGIEPGLKDSPKKDGTQIYAFAKTDFFMEDLLEHDDERVRALAEARLGVKSTLLQTRAESLGWMASRGALAVYLRYSGAGTLRPTGGDSCNFLNFKRGSPIRRALEAPDGYLLGPIDASQIEFRVGMMLAGQWNVIEQLRSGTDPYIDVPSIFYGEKIYKPKKGDPRADEMEAKRGMGKQAKLMCQYGAAALQFQKTAHNGLYGPRVDMSIEEAQRMVDLYREMHPALCAPNTGYWAECSRMLARLGGGPPMDWGIFHVANHRIYLPNGCPLVYDSIEYHRPEPDEVCRDFEHNGWWRMRTRQGWKKMWGSKLFQNLCEAVSRVIVSQAMLRINAAGFRTLNWPYDELLLLIPDDSKAEDNLKWCMGELKRNVDWLPGLPLDCEGSLGKKYSK